MYSGVYEITEHVYEIRSLYADIHALCREYASQKPVETVIEITEEDIRFEEERMEQGDGAGMRFKAGYLETLAVYRRIATGAVERGIVLVHCSAIAVDGVAYAFAAKSGTGKSTHSAIWRRVFGDRAVMINDDKPMIGLRNGVVTVYGTPWNGKHGLGSNTSAPLKGLCFLSRGERNVITKLENRSNAYISLLAHTFRPTDTALFKRTLEVLTEIADRLDFYKLECNMDDEAATVSYNGMKP